LGPDEIVRGMYSGSREGRRRGSIRKGQEGKITKIEDKVAFYRTDLIEIGGANVKGQFEDRGVSAKGKRIDGVDERE
jgi:hypothetical protein